MDDSCGIRILYFITCLFSFLKHISIKVKFIALFLFSAMFNFLWTSACESGESILDKLIEVSIFPYLYAFLFGGLMF